MADDTDSSDIEFQQPVNPYATAGMKGVEVILQKGNVHGNSRIKLNLIWTSSM